MWYTRQETFGTRRLLDIWMVAVVRVRYGHSVHTRFLFFLFPQVAATQGLFVAQGETCNKCDCPTVNSKALCYEQLLVSAIREQIQKILSNQERPSGTFCCCSFT